MRPYLILSAVILTAGAVFAQQAVSHTGYCSYGCGPYIPMVTTPEFSLQTISPNPVGASNATTGLVAGASNSTLSQMEAPSRSDHTVGVWYQGGSPVVGQNVRLTPESIAPEGHKMHQTMMHEEIMLQGVMHEGMEREVHMREGREGKEEGRAEWGFYASEFSNSVRESMGQPGTGQPGMGAPRKATRTFTNDDVAQENEKNGDVKINGKTEKI